MLPGAVGHRATIAPSPARSTAVLKRRKPDGSPRTIRLPSWPRPRTTASTPPSAGPDPRRRERAVRRARLRRGLDRGHRKRRRRHPRARAPLLRRPQGRLHRAARATRRPTRRTTPSAHGPQRPGATGRHRLTLARLDRGQPHDLARHDRPRRRHRRPRRQASRSPTSYAARSRCSRGTTPTSPRTHRGCATRRVLDRPQPRRDPTRATRRGHPRGDTRTARLNARARPAHVRRPTRAKPAHTSSRLAGGCECGALASASTRQSHGAPEEC